MPCLPSGVNLKDKNSSLYNKPGRPPSATTTSRTPLSTTSTPILPLYLVPLFFHLRALIFPFSIVLGNIKSQDIPKNIE